MPFPIEAVYHHLGNCIAPQHSVLALANCLYREYPDARLGTVPELIAALEEQRLRASKHACLTDDLAMYLGSPTQCEQTQSAFKLLMVAFQWHGDYQPCIPGDSFFHPRKGKCNVYRGQFLSPCQYGTTNFCHVRVR